MRIGDLCTREAYCVSSDAPLLEAVREMHRRHVGAVVVVGRGAAAGRPVGIVTDRDVVRTEMSRRADVFSLTTGEAMTSNPLVLEESCSLAQGINRLRHRGVRRAPVIDARGKLIGLISLDDVLPAVAESLTELAKLIGRQSRLEHDHHSAGDEHLEDR